MKRKPTMRRPNQMKVAAAYKGSLATTYSKKCPQNVMTHQQRAHDVQAFQNDIIALVPNPYDFM